MPLQLLLSDRSPFFGSFTISPFFQLIGMSSVSHIFWKICCRILGVIVSSAFIISAHIPSSPGALLFFCFLIARVISSREIGLRLISRSSSASEMLASSCGVGRLSTWWKCCFHLSSFALSSVITVPSDFLMGRSWLGLCLPLRVLVIL